MDYKDLKILYEDNHLLVVVKPYGVPVQEDGSGDPDMLNLLKRYLVEKYDKPGEAYLGLVHRLDRPTGGVMVFAKTSKAASRLSEAIRNGEVEKHYLAVVEGEPRFKADKLRCWLKKFPEQNLVLLFVNLYTGRGHQIRVQLAANGTPILGDARYGHGERMKLPLCLWAAELRFAHPVGGQRMDFRVYPPETLPWTLFDIERYLGINIKNV